jgi:hypothetical protein
MLGATLGALMHRSGWAFAAAVPIFALVRAGIQLCIRPGLIPPSTVTTAPYGQGSNPDWWYLHAGFVPLGSMGPAPGQTWSSNDQLIESCQSPISGNEQTVLQSAGHCERVNHLHYVQQFQPGSHFWGLQSAESAIFVVAACLLLGLTLQAVRRWRT